MLELRIVDTSFAELISRIVQRSFGPQAGILGIKREEHPHFAAFESHEKIRERMENGDRAVLAYFDGQPVGTVRYKIDTENPEKGFISRLAVLPDHRGKGYGDELMAFAEARLKELGAKRAALGMFAPFDRLREYYEGLGYTLKERKKFPDFPVEILFMEKGLS